MTDSDTKEWTPEPAESEEANLFTQWGPQMLRTSRVIHKSPTACGSGGGGQGGRRCIQSTILPAPQVHQLNS